MELKDILRQGLNQNIRFFFNKLKYNGGREGSFDCWEGFYCCINNTFFQISFEWYEFEFEFEDFDPRSRKCSIAYY